MSEDQRLDGAVDQARRIREFVLSRFPLARQAGLSEDDSLLESGVVASKTRLFGPTAVIISGDRVILSIMSAKVGGYIQGRMPTVASVIACWTVSNIPGSNASRILPCIPCGPCNAITEPE